MTTLSTRGRRAAGAVAIFLLSSLAVTAWASSNVQEAWNKFKGRIIVSGEAIPTEFESEKEMVDSLRKVNASEITARDGTWNIHFIGFLKSPPGTSSVHLVFYKKDGNKREYVSSREIHLDKKVKVVASDVQISGEDGVSAGKYELVLGRMANGKETVFAKTVVTLK